MEFKPGNAVWVKWCRYKWPVLVVSKEEVPFEIKAKRKMIFIRFLSENMYETKKLNEWMKPFDDPNAEIYSKHGATIRNPKLRRLFHCDLCAVRDYIKNQHTGSISKFRARSASPTIEDMCDFTPPAASQDVATSSTKRTFRRRTWPLLRQTPVKHNTSLRAPTSGFAGRNAAPVSTNYSQTSTRPRKKVSGKRTRKKRCESVTRAAKRQKLCKTDDKSQLRESVTTCDKTTKPSAQSRVKMPKLEPLPLEDLEMCSSTADLNVTYSMLDDLDSSDSDTVELPEFSFSQNTEEDDIRVGELVWVRYRSALYWPAVVRVVYKKKKRIKKVTVTFLDSLNHQECPDEPIKSYCLKYDKKRVIPIGVSYEQHKKKGLESAESVKFEAAVGRAEAFITKRGATRDTNFNIFEYFSNELSLNTLDADAGQIPSENVISTELPDFGLHDTDSDSQDSQSQQDSDSQADSDSQSEERLYHQNDEPVERTLTLAEQKMSIKRIARGAKIVDYINTDKMKKRLVRIYEGRLKSRRHDLFHKADKTADEKFELENQGFGPITDEDQEEKIVNTLMSYFKTVSPEDNSLNAVKYVLDVWVPEAIIYVITKMCHISFTIAETRFLSGVRWTKSEKREQRNDTIRNAENITEEDREKYRLRRERNLQKLGKTHYANGKKDGENKSYKCQN